MTVEVYHWDHSSYSGRDKCIQAMQDASSWQDRDLWLLFSHKYEAYKTNLTNDLMIYKAIEIFKRLQLGQEGHIEMTVLQDKAGV